MTSIRTAGATRSGSKDEGRGILLFDGVCNLCNGVVNFVIDHDRSDYFRFAPLQSAAGRSLLKTHGLDADALDSVVLLEDGRYYQKSDAALRAARRLEHPVRRLHVLTIIPRTIRDAVYDVIARNRYSWFGRQDACRVPTPELRRKFLAGS